jgi:hypothetical protein
MGSENMKNVAYLIFSLSLALFPCLASAKTAPITVVTNTVEEAQKEIEKFNDNMEVVTDVQMMVNSARDELNNLKEEAMKKASAYALEKAQKEVAKNKTLSGIADKMKFGDFATAAARDAYKDKYVFKSDVKNDVEAQVKYDENINEVLINNISAMYAQSLAKRYALQKEGKELLEEEKKQINDETSMINEVKNVKMRANKRWINILISMAGHQNNEATIQMQALKQIEDKEEQSGSEDEAK